MSKLDLARRRRRERRTRAELYDKAESMAVGESIAVALRLRPGDDLRTAAHRIRAALAYRATQTDTAYNVVAREPNRVVVTRSK